MLLELPFANQQKGNNASPIMSDDRAALVQQAQSPLWFASKQRKLFTANMGASGAVLPIFSGTTQQFGLFNPAGSGVNLNIVEVALTFVDTTGAAGGYVLALVKDAGADKATGGNLTSYTKLSVWDGLSDGSDASSVAKAKPLTAFGCTAPVIYRHIGLNQLVLTAADATNAQWSNKTRFDGDCGVKPGTVLCVAGNIATLSKWAASITWIEDPI